MTENRSDIDINDPNFWQKWAKKADIDTDASKSKVGYSNSKFLFKLCSHWLNYLEIEVCN